LLLAQRIESLLREIVITDPSDQHDRRTEPVCGISHIGSLTATATQKVSCYKIFTRLAPSFRSDLKIRIDTAERNNRRLEGVHKFSLNREPYARSSGHVNSERDKCARA
jgi:hypothetical protein